MFLRWDAIQVVVKYGWDAIREVVKYFWDAIHVEKGFRDAIHVQRLYQCSKCNNNKIHQKRFIYILS